MQFSRSSSLEPLIETAQKVFFSLHLTLNTELSIPVPADPDPPSSQIEILFPLLYTACTFWASQEIVELLPGVTPPNLQPLKPTKSR
jgi:hypothetical protein